MIVHTSSGPIAASRRLSSSRVADEGFLPTHSAISRSNLTTERS
jgi:hypothetical protein